jgi:probable F420-dependent oxidoreductase
MKVSLSLPQIADPTHPDPYWQSFALAQTADQLGYDTVTIGHHHFVPGNIPDPLMFMAAVAAKTQKIRVGTGIYLLAVHDPVRVAEQVALLDVISGGRAALGVGTGWNPLEYRVFGSDIHRRGARIDESIRLLQHLWTTEGEPWHGEFFDIPALTLYPRPVQRPHPPIAVAGVAPAAVERAARLGQAWLCGPVQSLRQASDCLAVYRPACQRLGKPADWVLRRYAWVGTDRDQVANEILPAYVDGLLEHWRESAEGDEEREMFARFDRGEPVDAEGVAADRLVWGTPQQCVEQIQRYRTETGVEHIHLAFGAGLPGASTAGYFGTFEQLHEMIELFGTEVLPVLERLGPQL